MHTITPLTHLNQAHSFVGLSTAVPALREDAAVFASRARFLLNEIGHAQRTEQNVRGHPIKTREPRGTRLPEVNLGAPRPPGLEQELAVNMQFLLRGITRGLANIELQDGPLSCACFKAWIPRDYVYIKGFGNARTCTGFRGMRVRIEHGCTGQAGDRQREPIHDLCDKGSTSYARLLSNHAT